MPCAPGSRSATPTSSWKNCPRALPCRRAASSAWGTAHAILVAEEAIGDAPFAVINADDYYGPQGFKLIYDYLSTHADGDRYAWAMVGFLLATRSAPTAVSAAASA